MKMKVPSSVFNRYNNGVRYLSRSDRAVGIDWTKKVDLFLLFTKSNKIVLEVTVHMEINILPVNITEKNTHSHYHVLPALLYWKTATIFNFFPLALRQHTDMYEPRFQIPVMHLNLFLK